MFQAILTEKDDAGYRSSLQTVTEDRLPAEGVRIKVAYSTLNYKDALAITGRAPILRRFPLVPGIDLAGTVQDSSDPRFQAADKVLITGWGLGESRWGGLAQQAVVPADGLVHLPPELNLHEAMAIGTAGYTAMLAVMALERQGLTPQHGDILVTGAAGGVGSVAVSLLSTLGYRVAAATGRPQEAAYLQALGAAEIVDRNTLNQPGRPLGTARWAGAIDSVGSHTLANVCATLHDGGVVAACGLAQGMDFPGSVAPFILRGISLLGINCMLCPPEQRELAWQRLATELKKDKLARLTGPTIGLGETIPVSQALLAGQVRGRVVVDVNA